MKKILPLLIMTLWLHGCGIFKHQPMEKEHPSAAQWNDFLKNYRSAAFNEPYLIEKWSVDWQSPSMSVGFTVRVDMIKDTVILFSVTKFGLPVGKAVITPERAAYYENWSNTCYDGTLNELGKKIGLDVDFHQLQAILTGDMPVDPDPDKWRFESLDDPGTPFGLYPLENSPVKEMIFNSFFKIFSEILEHRGERAEVMYEDYDTGSSPILPGKISVRTQQIRLDIKVKKKITGQKPVIRFQMPRNCKPVQL